MNADLVVLSACETALIGSETQGLGSLASSFLAVGADSVVASLWQVHSEATMRFMTHFYAGYGYSGVSQSLQDARKAVMAEDQYSHPYFWAPFIHFGRSR